MNLCNINDIKSLLGRHGFHFSKSMGQNFLIEDWVPQQIAESSGAAAENGGCAFGYFDVSIVTEIQKSFRKTYN